jgi:hypothetical protein
MQASEHAIGKSAYLPELRKVPEHPSPAAEGIKAVQGRVRNPEQVSFIVLHLIGIKRSKGPATLFWKARSESFQDALLQGVRYHKVLLLMPSQEPGEAP